MLETKYHNALTESDFENFGENYEKLWSHKF